MAFGGLILGIIGVLGVTAAIQWPLEPFLAPTPAHRLTQEEARALVTAVNAKIFAKACGAAEASP
jgi:hypothetical protein